LSHFLLSVREQRERNFVFVGELLLRLWRVGGYSKYNRAGFLEFLVVVTKLGRFDRSTRRICLRIEIKDYGLSLQFL
jgi:hypothetical protein